MPSTLTTHALTTVAAAKVELAIADAVTTYDAYLERLINSYSEQIERYCGRHFEYGTVTAEKKAGYRTMFLVLDRAPLVSITSISFDGSTIASTNYEIDDAAGGIVRFLQGVEWITADQPSISSDKAPGYERKLYSATYVAGYVTPTQHTGTAPYIRDLPYDLEQACLLAVATGFRARGRDRGIQSESLLSASVSYAGGVAGLPGLSTDVKDMLAPHRRAVFA